MTTITKSPWEEAYSRFETPLEEIAKFKRRLISLGAGQWPKDVEIVELFCGRGNGLHALSELGFNRITGVDLSPALIAEYKGQARCLIGDCRSLSLPSQSADRVIIQGGLHHLYALPEDLEKTLSEVRRILKPDGKLLIVEPWLTPFLQFIHIISEMKIGRKLSKKLDAFSVMRTHEKETYERWLARPAMIVNLLDKFFKTEHRAFQWGKLMFVGRPA